MLANRMGAWSDFAFFNFPTAKVTSASANNCELMEQVC